MRSVCRTLKILLLSGLPLVVLACCFLRQACPGDPLYEWCFMIALSGLVGISTNTIAIKMLFRPQNRTFFGRQGLIPKNRKKIAEKIAQETEKKLLNVSTIMAHIEKGRMIEETVSYAVQGVDAYLAREENRKKIAAVVLETYNTYADRIFTWLSRSAEAYLSDFISRRMTAEKVWQVLKPRIQAFFESDEMKHRVSGWIINHLIQRIPEISQMLGDMLERYIEEQVWWRKFVLRGVKEFSGVDREAITRFIRDVFNRPETYHQAVAVVEDNINHLDAFLEQDEVREKLELFHHWFRQYLTGLAREKAVPALREKIDAFLESDDSWAVIDRYLTGFLKGIPPRLQLFLHEKQNIDRIRGYLPGVITRLNIKAIISDNIEQQDTETFEKMIMKVSGDNLAAIEVLGGVIGMLAGVAIKMPVFLLVLPAGIVVFIFVDQLLTGLKNKRRLRP